MPRLACAVLLALALAAAPPNPVQWELRDPPARPVKPGTRFTLRLVAHIDQGWHLYSLKRLPDGPIPTRIWLGGEQPFQLGPVKAPEPIAMFDPNFNQEVEFFTGEAAFALPLRATPSAAGTGKVTVSASYQVCSDRVCLPPRTVQVETPLAVKP